MALHHACLDKFLEPVPTCSGSTSLLAALQVVSQASSDRLVVVDNQQHPVGIVHLHRLVSHLVQTGGFLGGADVARADQSLQTVPGIVDTLAIVPADWSIEQFLLFLQNQTASCYAVTGTWGEFLGLLDGIQLLKETTAARAEQATTTSVQFPPHLPVSTAHLSPIPPSSQESLARETAIRVQNRVLRGNPESTAAVPRSASLFQEAKDVTALPSRSGLAPFERLLELLERLPLPLMLQTGEGWVLAQSDLWRKQVGELLDPAWVRRDAAPLLATSQVPISQVPSTSIAASDKTPELSDLGEPPRPTIGSLCQLGNQPDTCVCTCVLKDGQERIWQFIKIPLDNLLSGWKFFSEPAALDVGSLPGERSLQSFRLATLTTHASQPKTGNPTASFTTDRTASTAWSGQLEELGQTGEPPPSEKLWLVLAQDITEQQQLARELTAKNADLIQLNRLKDEFLACISHELKTPLTAVLGLSSLLKDQTLGELNPRQVHYAQLIYQSGRHLMSVVNDILDLTRIETGQLELVPAPVNIETVCARALEQAKQLRPPEDPQADASEDFFIPQFSLEIEPGLESLVADELRLRQMLVNLLSNALKFTEVSSPVGLRVNRWGGWIAFTIWDTGIGIPTDKQHLIFQKFQQLENPMTRRFEGTGLGLVLTQRLARLHGGDVSFLSREGKGSQFTILLPPQPPEKPGLSRGGEDFLAESANPAPPLKGRVPLRSPRPEASAAIVPGMPAESSPAARNRLALIVEAVPQFIDTLSEHLASLGYRVVIARSGTEAVEKARRLQPCIIFLNPLLPMLSGWDVLTLLKSNPETRQLSTIITATQADEEQALRNYADGFLPLPVQLKPLQKILRRVVMRLEEPDLQTTSKSLTILRLSPGMRSGGDRPIIVTDDLNQLLHAHHYRILEADDLEQAELIARVWKPNVTLLDGDCPNWMAYFQQLSQHTFLASLPLVTLNPTATQVANQVPGLLVFPCLASLEADAPLTGVDSVSPKENRRSSALLQVIQIAAGYAWQPSVLAFDPSALPLSIESADPLLSQDLPQSTHQEVDWLQALTQYLQTAGLQGLLSHSWQEVMEQVQSQSVDLLLLCWTDNQLRPTTTYMLSTLQQLDKKLPVLVLDHRECQDASPQKPSPPIPNLVQQLAARILPRSTSMAELLDVIHQIVHNRQ
jgi:signal transduction histidine kinase/CheY-like chemotaxis protein